MASQYYYQQDGQRKGPLTAAELKALAAAGQLRPEDAIQKEGAADWKPAGEFKDLFAEANGTGGPPPLRTVPEPPPPPSIVGPPPEAKHSDAGGQFSAWLKRVLFELRRTAEATWAQSARLVGFSSGRVREHRLQSQAVAAQAALGRRLYEAGLGEATLRSRLAEIDDHILSLKAANASTRGPETERTGLYVRLARPFLDQAAPAGSEGEHAQAVVAATKLGTQQRQLGEARAELVPPDRDSRLRLAIGFGVFLLLALLLIAGIFWLFTGASRPAELVGAWQGSGNIYGMQYTSSVDFRSNGRVFWEVDGGVLYHSKGSGTWEVERIEDRRYTLEMVDDLKPDEVWGWVVVFKEDDVCTISGWEDLPLTVRRVK